MIKIVFVCLVLSLLLFILHKLIFTLFIQNIPNYSKQLNLTGKNDYEDRFIQVLNAFLSGSNSVLKFNFSINKLRNEIEYKFPSFYRGFAYEGAGMGLGIRASFSIKSGKKFENYIKKLSLKNIYQYYVGLGWWIHIRYGFNASKYDKWINQLESKLSPCIFDGVGFRTGLFMGSDSSNFSKFKYSYQRICYQGFGRSIWFRNNFNISKAINDIHYNVPDEFKDDTYSGLGLAVAYSKFDTIQFAWFIRTQIPKRHRIAFTQGLSFGWEARRKQNKHYWSRILKCIPEEQAFEVESYIKHVHEVEKKVKNLHVQDFYVNWMDKTRESILRSGKIN